jgi:addiction module RelE/StbE family toxin
MMVRWTPTAARDLQSLHAYILEENQEAAAATVEKILNAIEALERFPEMGRKGRVAGTRELVVSPYLIMYRVRKTAVELLAILHGARRWPDSFR